MTEDLHTGKDGWLFLVGGSNNLIKYYTEPHAINPILLENWVKLFEDRFRFFDDRGIKYLHLFIPNKLSLYPEYYLGELPYFNNHLLNSFFEYAKNSVIKDELNKVVNPMNFFNKQKDNYSLFWKTDSHWNIYGCFSGYQLICSSLNVQQESELMNRPFNEGDVVLDLGGKFTPKIKEKARFYDLIKNATRVECNEIVEYKESKGLHNDIGFHVGSNVVYKNDQAINKQKVVLFGDSFSEYRPHLLTGMLAETFSEVHFVWSTSVDRNYVDRVKPDIVISESVERFMTVVPSDRFDLEEYVKEKMSKV